MSTNFHWLSVRNILKYHIDLIFLMLLLSIDITKNNFPAPSQRVALVQKGMKARCWLCTLQEETEKASVCLWRRSCLLTLDVFFCELGQVSNKSPPPITQCPSRFTLGATERNLDADLKKQLLVEAPGRAIKYLPKKLEPIATQAEKLTEDDSKAFVSGTLDLFSSPSGEQTFFTLSLNSFH